MGRTHFAFGLLDTHTHFNSLAPCGANRCFRPRNTYRVPFQLTRPVWGEPVFAANKNVLSFDFNSLAPCGANRAYYSAKSGKKSISTHSPRVGRTLDPNVYCVPRFISTHSPRVGRTVIEMNSPYSSPYFNSLAPCGANRFAPTTSAPSCIFQLTRPVWGEPRGSRARERLQHISTHSPRVGRTLHRREIRNDAKNFNSLAPCGAKHEIVLHFAEKQYISTHSPRVGRTSKNFYNYLSAAKFQLTRPVWGEP